MSDISTDLTNATPETLALLTNTSAIPAPNGTTSNFVNPVDKGPTQIGVTSALLGIVVLFSVNRAHVKLILTKKITLDDSKLLG